MVVFVFVVMMLNVGEAMVAAERQWLNPRMWIVPALLAAILLAEIIYVLLGLNQPVGHETAVSPKVVGLALYEPYLLGVELASFLLLSGLVGAYHLGRRHEGGEKGGS